VHRSWFTILVSIWDAVGLWQCTMHWWTSTEALRTVFRTSSLSCGNMLVFRHTIQTKITWQAEKAYEILHNWIGLYILAKLVSSVPKTCWMRLAGRSNNRWATNACMCHFLYMYSSVSSPMHFACELPHTLQMVDRFASSMTQTAQFDSKKGLSWTWAAWCLHGDWELIPQ
jgi:hypothetical protein